jgi:hypothetical protein
VVGEGSSDPDSARHSEEGDGHYCRANHEKRAASDFVDEGDGCGRCEEVGNGVGSCDPAG